MKRTLRTTASAIAALAVVLSACGGGSSGSTAPAPAPAPSGGAAPAPTVTPGLTQPITVRISHMLAPGGAYDQSAVHLAETLQELSGGLITAEVFPGAQLVGPGAALEAVGDGRVEIAWVQAGYNPGELPLLNATSLPLLGTDNAEVMMRTIDALYANNELFRAEFDAANVVPIAPVPVAESLLVSKQPYLTLESMRGKSIRTLGYFSLAVTAAGGTPVALDIQDIYENLDRGVVDGATSLSLEAIVGPRLHEVGSSVQTIGFGVLGGGYWAINRDLWDSFGTELQNAILEDRPRWITRNAEIQQAGESRACDVLIDNGITLTLMDETEITKWRDSARPSLLETFRTDAKRVKGYSDAQLDEFIADYQGFIAQFTAEGPGFVPSMSACVARAN